MRRIEFRMQMPLRPIVITVDIYSEDSWLELEPLIRTMAAGVRQAGGEVNIVIQREERQAL